MKPVNQELISPPALVPKINVDSRFSTLTICPAVNCILIVMEVLGSGSSDRTKPVFRYLLSSTSSQNNEENSFPVFCTENLKKK